MCTVGIVGLYAERVSARPTCTQGGGVVCSQNEVASADRGQSQTLSCRLGNIVSGIKVNRASSLDAGENTHTRPLVGSAMAWNEKPVKKLLPSKVSVLLYVAARARPAARERAI